MKQAKLILLGLSCLGALLSCNSNHKTGADTTHVVLDTPNAAQTGYTSAYLDTLPVCSLRPPTTIADFKANAAGVMKAVKWTWEPGEARNIYVCFLDGNKTVQDKVSTVAKQWEPVASVRFIYVTDPSKADVKISFQNSKGGSWSYLGKEAKKYDTSMNYGTLNVNSKEKDYNRFVLHEFGHVLGLVHEHQNPDGNPIQWNKPLIIAYYTKYKILTREEVEDNIFRMEDNIIGTKFDPKSIMLYAFPAEFTKNHYATEWNYELSDMDKSLVRRVYTMRP